jgi:glycosyltransferase involved in cell wall biosynthesis
MKRQSKVLQVLGRSAGGIAGHVADISAGLHGRDGIEIDIAAPPDLEVRMPTEVIPVNIPDGLRGHRAATEQLGAIISAGGYSVVHAHGLRASIDSGRATRTTRALAFSTIHNLVLREISGPVRAAVFRRAEPLAVRWNDHVFAPSRDIAQRLREAATDHESKVEVLHLGVAPPSRPPRDREEVRAELGLAPTDQLLVTVARLAPQKALDVLLRALGGLPPRVHLAVIGSGPLESDLKRLADRIGVSPRVTWLGYRSDPQDRVAAADVFCLSSVWEACSLAAQEAMLLRTPVVATAVGGMPELIQDGVSGRLIAKGDHRAFAAAVGELLAAPEEGDRLAANAAVHLAEHFSRETMLERLRRAYGGDDRAGP